MAKSGKPDSVHPAAEVFPLMDEEQYAALKLDIAENGLNEPIVYLQGSIIDGRNRSRACRELNIEPLKEEIEDDTDPVTYVISANLRRRQLKTSQKAMCAAKVANLGDGRPAKTPLISGVLTCEQASQLFSVGTTPIECCRAILRDGSALITAMCEQGTLSVNMAMKLIEAVPDKKEQTRIARDGRDAIKSAIGDTTPVRSVVDKLTDDDLPAVERWLEAQDDRPAFERFRALWDSAAAEGRAAIRAFVLTVDD